jgi:hypothetical protein
MEEEGYHHSNHQERFQYEAEVYILEMITNLKIQLSQRRMFRKSCMKVFGRAFILLESEDFEMSGCGDVFHPRVRCGSVGSTKQSTFFLLLL